MDQKQEVTGVLGYIVTRWHDWRLTWNPADWAGINMFYITADLIWKPDLIMLNELNASARNFTVDDKHQVRIWADKASMNDIEGEKFNIEWSPTITLELFHQYNNFYYPLDIQTIKIEIHPWMGITGYGPNALKMFSEAVSIPQSIIVFSEFVREEDRFALIEGSSKSYIYSYLWNGLEFFIMFNEFKLQRQDYKFFSVIYFPLVLLMILSTFNIVFCTKDSRVRNSVMLLVSSTVYYSIFYNIVQHNTKFGLFESMLYINNFFTFTSNLFTIVEYYYECEYDLITDLSKEFYDKGRIYNDDTLSNRFRRKYKNYIINMRKIDVILNISIIGINIIVLGSQFKDVIYRYLYYTSLSSLTITVVIYVYRNINSLFISYLIYKIQYVHKNNSDKIDHEFINYYSDFEMASINEVTKSINQIYDPYFKKKDKENLTETLFLIVKQFDESNNHMIDRKRLSLLITSLSCDIKDLNSDNQKYIDFSKKLESKNQIYNISRGNTKELFPEQAFKNQIKLNESSNQELNITVNIDKINIHNVK